MTKTLNSEILIGDGRINELQKELGSQSWPEFMQHDSIVNKNWPNLYTDFLDNQFALFENNKLVGVGNSVPLNWQNSFEDLPAEGLDWAMEKAKVDFDAGLKPNLLVGVQILINREFQSKGISYKMLKQ